MPSRKHFSGYDKQTIGTSNSLVTKRALYRATVKDSILNCLLN